MADSDYAGNKVVAATVVGLVFSIGAVVLRYVARQYQAMRQHPEDWCIYLALLFKIGIDVAGIVLLNNGLGKHITEVAPEQLVTFLKTQYTGSFLYAPCITFVKLSLLFQYRRLFASHSKSFIWQINVLMGIIIAWCVAIIIVSALICRPIQALWDFTIKDGQCINLVNFYYGLQIPNLVTDILIIVLPIREMMGLELSKKVKIGATLMFLLGLLTLVFGTVRLVALVQLSSEGLDITYNEVYAAVWTTIEPAAAIVAVCIPSVRTLYRTTRVRSSVGYSNGSGKGNSVVEKWSNRMRASQTNASSASESRPGATNPGGRVRSFDPTKMGSWTGWMNQSGAPRDGDDDRRLSDVESDTGIIELGVAPGIRHDSESVAESKPYSMASTVDARNQYHQQQHQQYTARMEQPAPPAPPAPTYVGIAK